MICEVVPSAGADQPGRHTHHGAKRAKRSNPGTGFEVGSGKTYSIHEPDDPGGFGFRPFSAERADRFSGRRGHNLFRAVERKGLAMKSISYCNCAEPKLCHEDLAYHLYEDTFSMRLGTPVDLISRLAGADRRGVTETFVLRSAIETQVWEDYDGNNQEV